MLDLLNLLLSSKYEFDDKNRTVRMLKNGKLLAELKIHDNELYEKLKTIALVLK